MIRNMRNRWRGLWTALAVVVFFAAAYLLVGVTSGRAWFGVFGVVVMGLFGLVLLAGGRSEVVRVLRYEPTDERWKAIDVKATYFMGYVAVFAVIGLFFFEMARGGDGMPYAGLGALFGLSYLAALLWLARRA